MKELQMMINDWKQEADRLNDRLESDIEPTLLLELCTMRNRLQFCITDAELLLNRMSNNDTPPQLNKPNVSGSLPSRDDAKQEAKKRLRGRKNVIWKAQMFASGAMWAKMKITGISDVIGNDR